MKNRRGHVGDIFTTILMGYSHHLATRRDSNTHDTGQAEAVPYRANQRMA